MQTFVLENLNTAIVALDKDLKVLLVNPAAESLLDISDCRVQGLTARSITSLDSLSGDLGRALGQKQRLTRRESKLVTGHETVLVDYTVTPIDPAQASQVALLLEVHPRDRLQRITREESLAAKQETSKILARGLAHEIKNPLGGIRGAAQLLSRQLPNEELTEFTQVIIEEADRLRDLVDRMLGPLQPPSMKLLNIHEVLERVQQLICAETGGRLPIHRDYDPSIPGFPADRERLIQALLNIVRNAMQAIAQHRPLELGKITLQSRVVRQFTVASQRRRLVCQLSIIDNGPGIPANLKENIFYPMISGRADGTGLGLPLAQSIISQHQGFIECDSKPGHTCFTVYLPLSIDNKDHPEE